MARNLTANYLTAPQKVDEGVRYTMYRVTVRQPDATVVHTAMVAFGETKADFMAVAIGTYHARVELSSADGLQLGPGVNSAPFEVMTDDVTLEVPVAVSVTVHPLV